MPTETAPQPSVAAPAAVVTPPPAPAPVAATPAAPERPINSVTKKPISEAAHNLFKMLEESGDPLRDEPEEKKTPAPAAAATPAAEPAKPAPTADEPPVKVSKKVAKRPDLPIPAAEPTPVAPVTKPEPAPVDSKWEEELLDDEKAALEDARFAEKVDPKHKGLADKMGKFFRDQKKYLEEHPDADENDPAYKKILATAPSLTASDKRAISTARIKEEVAKEYKGRFDEVEQQLFTRDEEPKVEHEATLIRNHLAFNALPKEMLDVLKTKGPAEGVKALQKDYADEMEVAGEIINTLTDDAKELLRITRVNPKTNRPLVAAADAPTHPKWEQHNRIANMVNEVCRDFQKNAPQAEQVRDGKWFVTREEWNRLPANARHQFWTFGNGEAHVREMIERALTWAPEAINQRIQQRRESLQKRGWVKRTADPVVTPPATPPVASSAPSAPRPSPAPAPSSTPAGTPSMGQLLARRLSGAVEA